MLNSETYGNRTCNCTRNYGCYWKSVQVPHWSRLMTYLTQRKIWITKCIMILLHFQLLVSKVYTEFNKFEIVLKYDTEWCHRSSRNSYKLSPPFNPAVSLFSIDLIQFNLDEINNIFFNPPPPQSGDKVEDWGWP